MSEVTAAPAKGELFIHPNPVDVLLSPEKFDAFLAEIERETSALVPDVITQRGRDEIKKTAFKVTKTKTFLDELGKSMNEERRKEINVVDAARRNMRDKLDELKERVRKPVTEWEEREAERTRAIEDTMLFFRAPAHPDWSMAARTDALAVLSTARQLRKKQDADREELERLRAEAEQRRQEDAAKAAKEAAERAEAQRREQEAAEQNRREQEAARAAEATAQEQAARAAALADARYREELRRVEEQRQRLEDAQRRTDAEEKRLADEQEARERDTAHRAEVMAAAQKAIQNHAGIGQDKAKKIVLAIVAGEIPAVRLVF